MKAGFDAKRIFHNDTGLGNYGRDVIRVLHAYTPIDHLVLYNTKPSNKERLEKLERVNIKYPKIRFWKYFSSIWRLGPMVKQIAADDIDIFHGLSGETPKGLRKKGICSVVTIHDLIFLSHPQFYSLFDRIIYKKKFQHATKSADIIIAISQQTKSDIIKYLHIDPNKIRVVYQGCNEAYKRKYSVAQKQLVIKKYKLPQSFILNVGTLQERKNALVIVKAILGTDIKLVLVGGEKRYAKRVHAYIDKNGMHDQVIFLKNVPVDDLAIIYQLAIVFCYPSICEGFGIPIIEAMYSNTPVITSKGNCFPEAGGPSSLYIDPHDAAGLRQNLQLLLRNVDLRNKMVEEGNSYVLKFNDKHVAQNVFDVYRQVIEENDPRPSGGGVKITALMITYNEIEHIESVLANLAFADEIIVVDSFSTDGTVEVIRRHPNVKLIQREFRNFTDQKSFALEQATYDWVIFMDADEMIPTNLKKEILETINNPKNVANAYYFYRTFMFKDRVLRFSGWQTDKNYRLFRRSKVHFLEERIVHETLVVEGSSDVLKNKLIHYSYKDYQDYKDKMIKYGQMKALEELDKDYNPNVYHFILRPFYKFLNHYILRFGILDGKKGVIISYLNALGVYARYQELRRLRRKN